MDRNYRLNFEKDMNKHNIYVNIDKLVDADILLDFTTFFNLHEDINIKNSFNLIQLYVFNVDEARSKVRELLTRFVYSACNNNKEKVEEVRLFLLDNSENRRITTAMTVNIIKKLFLNIEEKGSLFYNEDVKDLINGNIDYLMQTGTRDMMYDIFTDSV